MSAFKPLHLLSGLLILLLPACAAVNVDVGEDVNWDRVSVVVLQPPPDDPWQLTAAVREELQDLGWEVAETGGAAPDLLVRFFVKEGPDLNAEGDLLTRLQSLHVQFLEPGTKQNVTVVDYFYPADGLTGPREGVTEAFAELQQEIDAAASRTGTVRPQTLPAAVESRPPQPAVEPQEQSTIEVDPPGPAATVPLSAIDNVKPSTSPEDPVAEEDADPAGEKAPAGAEQDDSEDRSPWIPRLETWGFDNWGNDQEGSNY